MALQKVCCTMSWAASESPPTRASAKRYKPREEAVEKLLECGLVAAQDPAGHGPVDVNEVRHCQIGRWPALNPSVRRIVSCIASHESSKSRNAQLE